MNIKKLRFWNKKYRLFSKIKKQFFLILYKKKLFLKWKIVFWMYEYTSTKYILMDELDEIKNRLFFKNTKNCFF